MPTEKSWPFDFANHGRHCWRAVRKHAVIECLATGFYSGKAPFMPGTFGTLVALPLAWVLSLPGPGFYMVATLIVIAMAIAVAEVHEKTLGSHDAGEIVIDEIAGYLVAFTWLPVTWQSFAAAFVLFRVLDILKPFPISYLDRKIRGGLGVVLDDVAAGLIASVALQVVYAQTSWLGEQLHVVS